jgi:glutathione S-transferase
VLFDYVERSLAREGYERASAIDHREADRLALNTHVGLAHPSNEN